MRERPKVSVCFRRLPDGKVVADIVDMNGVLLESRDFGIMSVEEFEGILDLLNKDDPELKGKILPTIKLTEN